MFCEACGTQIADGQRFCPKCVNNQIKDKPSIGFAILSFFIPLVGLILFLVWKKDMPIKAKSCGIGALIGFILSFLMLFIPFLK